MIEDLPRIQSSLTLFAVNGLPLASNGRVRLTIDLGFGRTFSFSFFCAKVDHPILGIDFLTKFRLVPFAHTRTLLDCTTNQSIECTTAHQPSPRILAIEAASSEQQQYIEELIREFPAVFDTERPFNPATVKHPIRHYIDTGEHRPITTRVRPMNPMMRKIAEDKFAEMMKRGVCRRSSSNWSLALHMVRKGDGSWRPVTDARPLNAITKPDRYPIPYIQDVQHNLSGCTVFSCIDLKDAFSHVPVNDADVCKTATITPFGLFEFPFMNPGLCTAAQTFQRLMDTLMREHRFMYTYLDDQLASSGSTEQHRNHLRTLFSTLNENGMVVNAKKSQFFKSEVHFLGYIINKFGIRPNPKRVEAIRNLPDPTTVKELRHLFGAVNFYHKQIPRLAEYRIPFKALLDPVKVNKITVKRSKRTDQPPIKQRRRQAANQPIILNEEQKLALKGIRDAIASAALLYHPQVGAPLIIHTDASEVAAAGVLHQLVDGELQPLRYFSKRFDAAEKLNTAYERELEAAYLTVKKFSTDILGRETILYSDNQTLVAAVRNYSTNTDGMKFRRLKRIADSVDEVRHLPGSSNLIADLLSRPPTVNAIQLLPSIDYEPIFRAQRDDPELRILKGQRNSKMRQVAKQVNNSTMHVWCYEGDRYEPRIYIPQPHRRPLFDAYHSDPHHGYKATTRNIAEKHYWPSMKQDIRNWVLHCRPCQMAKIHRHDQPPPQRIVVPPGRFQVIHVDIVGPLPTCQGFRYILTVIDRYSRWMEAQPMTNQEAKTACRALVSGWIQRFGVPNVIITDRGSQFESDLFIALTRYMGIRHQRTSAYHPKSNGFNENPHRHLKAALIANRSKGDWVDRLPVVMMAFRNQLREDLQASPSQMVLGTNVQLPADFFEDIAPVPTDRDHLIVLQFDEQLRTLRSATTCNRSGLFKSFKLPDLDTCEYIWKRYKPAHALDNRYIGPFKVVRRNDTNIWIQKSPAEVDAINREHCKPAYIENPDIIEEGTVNPNIYILHFPDPILV